MTEAHNLVKHLVLYMHKHKVVGRQRMNLSTIGQVLFPPTVDKDGLRTGGARNSQGAALSAGKWVKQARDLGLVTSSRDGFGVVLTHRGEMQAADWLESGYGHFLKPAPEAPSGSDVPGATLPA